MKNLCTYAGENITLPWDIEIFLEMQRSAAPPLILLHPDFYLALPFVLDSLLNKWAHARMKSLILKNYYYYSVRIDRKE